MLSPLSITGRLVMDSRQEFEILDWDLSSFDTEFMIKFPLCSPLNTHHGFFQFGATFTWNSKWMGAACIGPHIWESNLLGRPLLDEQFVLRIKEENREGAMQQPLVNIGHEMACIH
jgi:hypothetical protein